MAADRPQFWGPVPDSYEHQFGNLSPIPSLRPQLFSGLSPIAADRPQFGDLSLIRMSEAYPQLSDVSLIVSADRSRTCP